MVRKKRSAPSSWYVAFDTTFDSSVLVREVEYQDGLYSELSFHRLHIMQSGKSITIKIHTNRNDENGEQSPDSSSSVGSENVASKSAPNLETPSTPASLSTEDMKNLPPHKALVLNSEVDVSSMIDEAFSSSPFETVLPTPVKTNRTENRRGMKKKKNKIKTSVKTSQSSRNRVISQAIQRLEKVDTIPFKTGTLYIYRGANPRVEFIRQQL